MPVTRSWAEKEVAAPVIRSRAPAPRRSRGLLWLIASSILVNAGLLLVFLAKTQNFAEIQARLDRGDLLNLNAVSSRDQLLLLLRFFPDPAERARVADKTFKFLQTN